ncbi:MAG: methyltransferase domain-containing protein [Candidatus Dormibacteraeota bacterium]|nr:methyltransferase domain-containing protein [Candidatus Dormibacteraeota bacterium]
MSALERTVSSPRPGAAAAEFFDSCAESYEGWAAGLRPRVAARLLELVKPEPGAICLDVGCGTGLVAKPLGKLVTPGGHVIGIDISAGMLALARRGAPPNFSCQRLTAEPDLCFRDASFDLVTFGDSLAYLRDPYRSLNEARRVLKPTGRIGVSVHRRSLDTLAQQVFFGVLDEFAGEQPIALRQPRNQRSLLGEAGVLGGMLEDVGFTDMTETTLVTGGRVRTAAQWLHMMAGAGPRPYALLHSLGLRFRQRILQAVESEMRRLGEDAFHYHLAYTIVAATAAATDQR